MQPVRRRAPVPFLGLLVALSPSLGCESSQPPAEPSADTEDPRQVDFTDPEAILDAYAVRLTHGASEDLLPLLAADFRYCVREADEARIPWLEGPCWDRDVESTILRRMAEAGSPALLGIALITESLEAIPGEIRVRTRMPVITSGYPDPGMNRWITRLDVVLVDDARGTLRVREIREVASASSRSWSLFKSAFHPSASISSGADR